MKRETQNDLRYIKTEALIQSTFRDMLREKDYTQMSIKELTERARINRKTFYLHYSTLDELLGKLQSELYAEFLQSISSLSLPDDLEKLIRELFTFCRKTDRANEKILFSQGHFPAGKSPRDNIRKLLFDLYHSNEAISKYSDMERNIIDAFLSGSIFFIYAQWIADNCELPLETVVQLTTNLLLTGFSNVFEHNKQNFCESSEI